MARVFWLASGGCGVCEEAVSCAEVVGVGPDIEEFVVVLILVRALPLAAGLFFRAFFSSNVIFDQ